MSTVNPRKGRGNATYRPGRLSQPASIRASFGAGSSVLAAARRGRGMGADMAALDTREPVPPPLRENEFSVAEVTALAHLYRGEVYRSTIWRTRLDSSTNWAVVTTGIAL